MLTRLELVATEVYNHGDAIGLGQRTTVAPVASAPKAATAASSPAVSPAHAAGRKIAVPSAVALLRPRRQLRLQAGESSDNTFNTKMAGGFCDPPFSLGLQGIAPCDDESSH